MRIMMIAALLFSVIVAKSQTASTGIFPVYFQKASFANNLSSIDSTHKWFFSTHSGMATNVSFFRGAEARNIAVPIAAQLNRQLNKNFYAFVNVAVTPAFTSLRPSLISSGFNNGFKYNAGELNGFNAYPSASIGIMYVNDAKTFWISGGITAEKSGYIYSPYSPAKIISKTGW